MGITMIVDGFDDGSDDGQLDGSDDGDACFECSMSDDRKRFLAPLKVICHCI